MKITIKSVNHNYVHNNYVAVKIFPFLALIHFTVFIVQLSTASQFHTFIKNKIK